MGVAFDIQSILDSLKSELTTRIPTAITDIASDGGPALPALSAIAVVHDIDEPIPYARPHVAIMVDGVAEHEDMLSHKRNLRLPLKVAVTMDAHSVDETGINLAHYWGRAVDMALTRTHQAGAISGVYWIGVEGTELNNANGDARNMQRVDVTALVHARTDRAT